MSSLSLSLRGLTISAATSYYPLRVWCEGGSAPGEERAGPRKAQVIDAYGPVRDGRAAHAP
ncbi:hypothetical protein GCM10010238_14790 [Streptomyces griseoviridis]|uniref:Uncharacterized protein n=1 Tax=Streptomyces griseoviridis TaxID=45398 RepID=A0A918LB59_STRGD|nr:hypothetical protein GCM10010238_14790 [Streptomyces niveoruber]